MVFDYNIVAILLRGNWFELTMTRDKEWNIGEFPENDNRQLLNCWLIPLTKECSDRYGLTNEM